MKKRYLVLTALLALSLAACSQEKAKMKMEQLKQNKQPKLMEQLEVSLKGAAQKKSRSGQQRRLLQYPREIR